MSTFQVIITVIMHLTCTDTLFLQCSCVGLCSTFIWSVSGTKMCDYNNGRTMRDILGHDRVTDQSLSGTRTDCRVHRRQSETDPAPIPTTVSDPSPSPV